MNPLNLTLSPLRRLQAQLVVNASEEQRCVRHLQSSRLMGLQV